MKLLKVSVDVIQVVGQLSDEELRRRLKEISDEYLGAEKEAHALADAVSSEAYLGECSRLAVALRAIGMERALYSSVDDDERNGDDKKLLCRL